MAESTPPTLPDLIRRNVSGDGADELAIIDDRGRRLTYRELLEEATAFCEGLRDLGMQPGSVVALLAPNSADWIISLIGSQMTGATVAAFHTWVKEHDLQFLLTHSEADLLVMAPKVGDHDLLQPVTALVPELVQHDPGAWKSDRFPRLSSVVVLGDAPAVPRGAIPSTSVLGDRRPTTSAPVSVPSTSVAVVLYTSGSTADPKGVPLLQGDLVRNGFEIGERMGLGPADRIWLGSPLFWSFGAANALVAAFSHGSSLVVQEKFNAQQAAEQISREGCTAAYLLPAMTYSFLQVPDISKYFATVRTGLTIGRSEEIQMVVERLGVEGICNIYGSTETYGNCCVTPFDMPLERRLRCQGPPLPGFEIRIVDETTGQSVPAGHPGAVYVRGRVTPGYQKAADLNQRTFTADGWYRTGDVGFLDSDGAFTFVTRDSDMIKTNGINVSPAEIEDFISRDPAVAQVVVVGVPDPLRGQTIAAFVKAANGSQMTPEDVIERCRRDLAAYKVPHSVHIVDAIPLTATGKLSRKLLLTLLADESHQEAT